MKFFAKFLGKFLARKFLLKFLLKFLKKKVDLVKKVCYHITVVKIKQSILSPKNNRVTWCLYLSCCIVSKTGVYIMY